jgi:hypothetical protein
MRFIYLLFFCTLLCYGSPAETKPIADSAHPLGAPCAANGDSLKTSPQKQRIAHEIQWQCPWRSAPLKFTTEEDSAISALFFKHGLHSIGRVTAGSEIVLDTQTGYEKDFFTLVCNVSHSIGICPEKAACKRLRKICIRLRERVWDGDSTMGTVYIADSSIVAAYLCLPKYVPGISSLKSHAELMPENFKFPLIIADDIDSMVITDCSGKTGRPESAFIQSSVTARSDLEAFAQLMKQCRKRHGEFKYDANASAGLFTLQIRYRCGSLLRMDFLSSTVSPMVRDNEDSYYIAPVKLLSFVQSKMPAKPSAGVK